MDHTTCTTDVIWNSIWASPRYAGLLVLMCAICCHQIVLIIYRLFFSPLAKFPGPRLAAATGLYELYFNLVKNGEYVFEIERLHDIYGPIVRVNPYELCIRDAEFHDKIYVSASVRPTEIYNHYVDGVDFQGSHFLTISHDLHRLRRKPLEPYFSRLGISQFEPVIQQLAEKFASRLYKLESTNSIVRLDHAMMCYTGDTISNVCCKDPTSLLDDESFSEDWFESLHTVIKSMPLFEGFPWILSLVRYIPESILLRIDPRSQLFNDWKNMAEKHILETKRGKEIGQARGTHKDQRSTLFEAILDSNLPKSELSTARLVNEAQVLLGTGTIGTSRVLGLTSYHILANPSIRARVIQELREPMRDWPQIKPSWAELEKLPYLQAVLKEGLRLSYGVMRRLPRISPRSPIQFRQWSIPAGTPVGMSAYMQHTDVSVFPEPLRFIPERWLPENVTPSMYRNFVPFAKGSRNCLGMNLAYAEMYQLIAVLFHERGPRFQLYDTDETDVKPVHDFVVPLPRVDSKGIRVIMR